jgi:hypothetical protein
VFYLYYPDPRRQGTFKMAHIVKHQIFGEPVDVTPRYARREGGREGGRSVSLPAF